MSNLKQAIAVGEYPAPCFDALGEPKEKQHRRFLRRLAQQGKIQMVDLTGNALDVNAVVKGAVHYKDWHVSPGDAQVILEQIETEAARLGEERRKAAEAREDRERKAAEERAGEQKRRARERKARRVLLEVAGQWAHPLYKTLKAARTDGWHERRHDEVGGDEITLKGHTLVRNTIKAQPTKQKQFVYKITLSKVYGLTPTMIDELGEPDEYCENLHWKTGPFPARLYSIERVESWIEENQERVAKARLSRAARSAAAKHVHDTKRAERYEKARAWVMGVPITVNRPFADTLLADARKSFAFHGHQDCLLEKGLHAYVRHRLTNYETLLKELYRKDFSASLYPLLREQADAAVEDALIEWRGTTAQIEPKLQHEWVVYSTALKERWLMLQCVECGALGTVDDPTREEWRQAFHAPSAPYLWTDEVRVHVRNDPPCPRYVERDDDAPQLPAPNEHDNSEESGVSDAPSR